MTALYHRIFLFWPPYGSVHSDTWVACNKWTTKINQSLVNFLGGRGGRGPGWPPRGSTSDGMSGCALYFAHLILATSVCAPSSSTRSRTWLIRRTHHHGNLDLILGINLPPRWHPRHVTVFVYSTFSYETPPLTPTASCAAPSSSTTSTLCRPRLLYAWQPRPWLFTLISAFSTSAQRAIIRMSYSSFSTPVAASTPRWCYDSGDVNPLALLQSDHLQWFRCDYGGCRRVYHDTWLFRVCWITIPCNVLSQVL